jgi:tetratricopeptide (TPR) repeat protein
MGLEETALAVLEIATVTPTVARDRAMPVLAAARRSGDWASVSIAARALGVAYLQLNEVEGAIGALREAVVAGRRAGADKRAGEARMSLASALVVRGRTRQALQQIRAALGVLEGVQAARALTQRAAIFQELGRLDEALEDLRRALPVLRRVGDAQWETRALSNRGLIYAGRRAFGHAEADFTAARRLCEHHDLALAGVLIEHNLAYVRAQRGDVPAALQHLHLAEEGYRRHGLAQLGTVLADRAELLLSVRLVREARVAAEAALVVFEQQHRQVNLPEAQLLLSTAALLDHDPGAAVQAAEDAGRSARTLGRHRLLPLARWARIQALVTSAPDSVRTAEVRRVAAGLRAAGWTVPGIEAQILAGQLGLRRGGRAAARSDLSGASRGRWTGPADVRSRAWLAEALRREADGDRRGAVSALRAGLRVVEDYRATLGATELRTQVSVHRGALARLGLRLALEDRRPRAVLSWAERGRANALLMRPVTPPEDPVLDRELSDLRATSTELRELRVTGRPLGDLEQRLLALERRVRDRCREIPGAVNRIAVRSPGIARLAATLGDLEDVALVEYLEHDGQLHAVTLVGGRTRLHHLGPIERVPTEMVHLPFALHRLASRSTRSASRAAAAAVLRRAGDALDGLLVRPLLRVVGDRRLLVVPSGGLQSVPWSVLPSLAGRSFTVSPSATLWHLATTAPAAADGAVLVAAGPGLPGGSAEADGVAAQYQHVVRLGGRTATAAAVSAAMDGAALVHLAAHGTVRADNPLFSSVGMADGPFTVYDLERLRVAPRHVVLAACDAGRSQVLAGEEILGFTAALLATGTSTLVAPVLPVPDAETAPLMLAYHRYLGTGSSAADALARAQEDVRRDDPVAAAGAATFLCLGAGFTTRAPSR